MKFYQEKLQADQTCCRNIILLNKPGRSQGASAALEVKLERGLSSGQLPQLDSALGCVWLYSIPVCLHMPKSRKSETKVLK